MALALALALAGCVKESRAPEQPRVPPNVRAFSGDFRTLWFTLTAIITREFGLPMKAVDMKAGIFTTQTIYDSSELVRARSTLSGSIKYDGAAYIVSLYHQVEVQENGRWQVQTTNYGTEQAILNRLRDKLAGR